MASFDPYHKWLAIPAAEQPPNHYRLLGIAECESDADVIETAAERQTLLLRTFQTGPNAELAERLLNEVSEARVCLLDENSKTNYDREQRASQETALAVPPPVVAEGVKERQPPPIPVKAEIAVAESPLPVVRSQEIKRLGARKPIWSRPWVIGVVAVVVVVILQRFATRPQQSDFEKGLVARYLFDGNAQDESGQGHHGTFNGKEAFVADRHGNPKRALGGGNGGQISIPDHDDFDLGKTPRRELTISLWFTGRGNFIFKILKPGKAQSNNIDYRLWVSSGTTEAASRNIVWGTGPDKGTVEAKGQAWTTVALLGASDEWHHLVASCSQGEQGSKEIFLDGKRVYQGKTGVKNPGSQEPLRMGPWQEGSLDDVRIYKRAFTEAEVKALYRLEKRPPRVSKPPTFTGLAKKLVETNPWKIEFNGGSTYVDVNFSSNGKFSARDLRLQQVEGNGEVTGRWKVSSDTQVTVSLKGDGRITISDEASGIYARFYVGERMLNSGAVVEGK